MENINLILVKPKKQNQQVSQNQILKDLLKLKIRNLLQD